MQSFNRKKRNSQIRGHHNELQMWISCGYRKQSRESRKSSTLEMCACCHFRHVRLFVTPWAVAHQAPLSIGFSRQKDWSGLPFYFAWDLPNPGVKSTSLMFPALVGGFFTTSATWGSPQLSYQAKIFCHKRWMICGSNVVMHRDLMG